MTFFPGHQNWKKKDRNMSDLRTHVSTNVITHTQQKHLAVPKDDRD